MEAAQATTTHRNVEPRERVLATVEGHENANNWLLALMAGVLALVLHVSFLASLALGIGDHPIKLPLRLAVMTLVAACTGFLIARRRSPTKSLCAGVFTLVLLPFFVTFWITEHHLAMLGRLGIAWDVFLGPKMVLFVVAALCPSEPKWLAPTLLSAFALEQLAMWFALNLGAPEANVSYREPGLSLSCVGLAGALLWCRLHHTRRERDLSVARADASTLRTTNEAFLAVQDMANTPLQNLEIALSLLEQRQPGDPVVHAARRAVTRLRELSHRLPVDRVTHASIDSTSLERIRELRNDR